MKMETGGTGRERVCKKKGEKEGGKCVKGK